MCKLKYSHAEDLFKIEIFLCSVNATQLFVAWESAFSGISLCLSRLHVTVLCLFFRSPHTSWH